MSTTNGVVTTKPNVQILRVNEIIEAPFNPPGRIEKGKLESLRDSIARLGILTPLTVSRDKRLIDGHRRLACAKALGMTEVPCLVVSVGLQEGWTEHNVHTAPISAAQLMYANSLGLSEEYIPPKQRSIIARFRETAGERYEEFSAAGVSPNAIHAAWKAAKYVGRDTMGWKRKILWWMIDTTSQWHTERAIRLGFDPVVLRSAIMEGKPLRMSGASYVVQD